jgi:hypothetical protein
MVNFLLCEEIEILVQLHFITSILSIVQHQIEGGEY